VPQRKNAMMKSRTRVARSGFALQATFARLCRRAALAWWLALALPAPAGAAGAAELTLGAKNFTEQYVLAEITAQYLRARGYSVDVRAGLGSTLMRRAQETGQIDLAWEYTGTALIVYHGVRDRLDASDTYHRIRDIDAGRGLVWLTPSGLNNTYALAMPERRAAALDLHTVSQLACWVARQHGGERPARLTFAMDAEFAGRPDGLAPLLKAYDLRFDRPEIRQMDSGLVYTALRQGQTDIGLVYTTDGRVQGFDIRLLEDDRGFFPAYQAAPVVRRATLDRHPDLAARLGALARQLDSANVAEMNRRVDIDETPVAEVAADFLRTHPLP
jgi:osmoprotectant transport system substrate-binding protein